MSAFEKLNTIKENISGIQCPEMLFEMNKRVRELQNEILTIKNLNVVL